MISRADRARRHRRAGYAYYWLGAGPQRLTERNPLARAGKKFLVIKYYLDVLYTDIIVGSLKGPIADGVYWVNQHVIDNVLNYAGQGARIVGRFTYEYVDQRGVDGSSTASRPSPARRAPRPATCRPVGCSCTR